MVVTLSRGFYGARIIPRRVWIYRPEVKSKKEKCEACHSFLRTMRFIFAKDVRKKACLTFSFMKKNVVM
jgi:hypothetical protein